MLRSSILILAVLLAGFAVAQETSKPDAEKQTEPAKRPISTSARLALAKTAYLKNNGGIDIPFDIISGAVDGWGRFQLVDDPEKADVVVEVTSPDKSSSGSEGDKTTISASGGGGGGSTGRKEKESTAKPGTGPDGPIRLRVYETKTKVTLFSTTEQPKGAMRERTHQENIIEATQKLVTKLHQKLEPEAEAAPPQ